MRFRWQRLISAMVAAGCAVALWQIAGLIQVTSPASTLKIAAMVVTGLGGGAAVLLTLAPHRVHQRRADLTARLLSAVRSTELPKDHRTGLLFVGLAVLTFAALAGRLLSFPDDPWDDDQGAFLETAAAVHESGGPVCLIADLYAGRFAEANRHPLYIGLLSLRPTVSFGRGLSTVLGLTTLLSITWLTARLRGTLVGGFVCLLLATNMAFCLFSTRIVCDVLMVLWGGGVFLWADRVRTQHSWQTDLALGVVLGLAYLTKGTGLLLLVGVLLWRLTLWRWPLMTRPATTSHNSNDPVGNQSVLPAPHGRTTPTRLVASLVLILAGWGIVVSPLLVRNVQMYGKPLYNVNNWLLFVDTFEQPVPLSQRQTVAETARAYWESHTLADMLGREVSGLVWEAFTLVRMLGPCPLDDSRVLFGLPLLLCAVIAIAADPRREHLLLGFWTVLLVGMFAWYVPIAAGERFLLPLLAPLIICASEGLQRVFSILTTGHNTRRRLWLITIALLYCGAILLLSLITNGEYGTRKVLEPHSAFRIPRSQRFPFRPFCTTMERCLPNSVSTSRSL